MLVIHAVWDEGLGIESISLSFGLMNLVGKDAGYPPWLAQKFWIESMILSFAFPKLLCQTGWITSIFPDQIHQTQKIKSLIRSPNFCAKQGG